MREQIACFYGSVSKVRFRSRDQRRLPGPSFSTIRSQWKARLVILAPVEWSVNLVELLRSIALGGGRGGDTEDL